MPHMDGFELLKAIRALDLAAGRDPIPAIAVTAYASAETRARCLRAGFVGHVAKPFNTTALIEAVAAAVDRTPGTVW